MEKKVEEEEGPPEDAADQRARQPSKFARFFDAADQTALYRSEYKWNAEEDNALIQHRSIPYIKLTRTQSAHRRELLSKLGGGTQSAQDAVMQHQISREPPEFSLDTGDKRSWQKPGQSVVQEYLRVSQVRAKELKVACAVRHFPGQNAQQSAIRFYLDTRDGKARLNPYADVEKIFSSKKHSLAALLKNRAARTDPYMANPYIDQDDAKTIAKSARQIRIRISQLGIINIALRGKGKGNDKDVNHLLTASEAWQKIPLQPTKTTVDEVRDWKLLGEKDPRLEVSPTGRRGHTMIKIDSVYALVFGGALGKGFQYSSQLFKFLFHTHQFEQIDVTGTRPCGRAFHAALWVDDTKMVIFGGLGKQGSLDDSFEYDAKESQWGVLFQSGAVRPAPRYGHTMTETTKAGVVLVYGGAGAGFFDDLFLFDTRTGCWDAIQPHGTIPAPRAFHSAVSLQSASKMFVFGGQNGSTNLADLHEYHIESNTWSFVHSTGVQPSPRWSHSVVKKGNDTFIIFGGAGETFFDQILFYNSYKAHWKQAYGRGPGPDPRWGHCCLHQEQMGKIFVFGGCTKDAPSLRDVYELAVDKIIFGVPPQKRKKKTLAGFDEPERNPIADMILEEKSTNWSETRRSNERRWSATAKRHTQGSVVVLTQVAPYASQQRNLFQTVGAPTIGSNQRHQPFLPALTSKAHR